MAIKAQKNRARLHRLRDNVHRAKRAVKRAIQIPLIVGGGIRSPAVAAALAKAGADILVTGTVIEQTKDAAALRDIVAAVKGP